jgi:hypothetical protein
MVVKRFRWDQDFRQSQLIFIGLTEKKHLGPILSSVKGAGVLTVSDVENFSSSGGMIGFVFDVDRIRFEINLDPAVDSHISISSKLLSLASAVKGNALANKPVPENRCWTISAGSFAPFFDLHWWTLYNPPRSAFIEKRPFATTARVG